MLTFWGDCDVTSNFESPGLYNVCVQYDGGVQYRGGCSVLWGYQDKFGGYLEYREGCSVP